MPGWLVQLIDLIGFCMFFAVDRRGCCAEIRNAGRGWCGISRWRMTCCGGQRHGVHDKIDRFFR